jgi:beta-lactamase regulating signal transducer with metallopeptidase domain
MSTLPHVIDTLLLRLAWTTGQTTVLIGLLGLLERYLRRLSPAMRCMLWWLVAAQLLLGLTVSTPVELPWLPATTDMAATIVYPTAEPTTNGWGVATTTTIVPMAYNTAWAPTQVVSAWSWSPFIVALWLLGVLLHIAFAVKQWHESRALVRHSQPTRDATLQLLCAEQAHRLGLRQIPHLRVSDAIVSPQVTGLWRPLVLLPAGQTLSSEELSMALAHELAHLRRGDLWLGWVPAIAQRLFFFHPLVRWAMREYAVYREAACDAKVLQQHQAAPQSYGHLLLRLGVAHPVRAGLAGASSTFENLKRRLLLLQQSVNDTTPRAPGWLLVAIIALVGVLPYRVTATSATPATGATQTLADSVPLPPAAPTAPAMPLPATATPPPPPLAPAPPAKPLASTAHHVDIDISSHADTGRGFALIDGNTVIVNGSSGDESDAYRLRQGSAPIMWFRRGDQAYVVHDTTMIERAKNAYAPISRFAQAQGELAGRQGELAGEQGGLAARQGALASRAAELEGRRARIEAQRAGLQAAMASSDSAALEESVKGQLAGLNQEAAEISRENKEIDRAANDLSKRASALSKQEAEMSKQQQAAARQAEQQLDRVLSEAMTKGLAEPVER